MNDEQKRPSLARRSVEQARDSIQQARQSIEQAAEDVKESTDSSLLAVARFFGFLYGPIDRRARIDVALRKALNYRVAPHVNWKHALGGITYLLFMILIVTGVLLSFYYRPSAQEAYPSIQHITTEISFGWLIRGLHYWASNLIVVTMFAHMARVYFDVAYKAPRETNWLIGVLLVVLVFGFGATGYLLPWDQWSYWTVSTVLAWVAEAPIFGGLIAEVLTGDNVVSGATLSRYFALHVIVLPWIALALLSFHFTLVRRHKIAPPKYREPPKGEGTRFFPNHLLKSFSTGAIVLAVIFSIVTLYPRPMADVADPGLVPERVESMWVAVDATFGLIELLGIWGLPVVTVLGLALALIPIFDRDPERRLRRKPVVVGVGILFFGGLATSWVVGRTRVEISPSPVIEESTSAEPGLPLRDLGVTPIRPAPPADSGGAGGGGAR